MALPFAVGTYYRFDDMCVIVHGLSLVGHRAALSDRVLLTNATSTFATYNASVTYTYTIADTPIVYSYSSNIPSGGIVTMSGSLVRARPLYSCL